jgi:uncharacterized membrane protein YsdA (DUF1294 family)/cold shock CspA family protein
MRYQGKVNNWKDEQGFGFITPNGGGKQIFVHIKSFSNRQRRPVSNEMVTYELKTDVNGRLSAESVRFHGERMQSATSSERSKMPFVLTAVFLVFVVGAVLSGMLPIAVLMLYAVASAITFVAYAFDKSAAKSDQWRTQESTLHFLALVGGWPGALAAQRLLRHKSKKPSFQFVFWMTIIFNCSALGWLLAPSGNAILHSILGTFESYLHP